MLGKVFVSYLHHGSWVVLESSFTLPNSVVPVPVYAVGWLDKKLKAIISTSGNTLKAATDSVRRRHRKVVVDGKYTTEAIDINIPRPHMIESFFETFAKIDIHDHLRQGILEVERYWLTQRWWLRFFGTIFAIYVVNSFLGYRFLWPQQRQYHFSEPDDFEEFTGKLAYQMVFNPYLRDRIVPSTRLSTTTDVQSPTPVTSTASNSNSRSNQFVPTLKPLSDVKQSRKRCKVNKCREICSFFCMECSKDGKFFGVCGSNTNRQCWGSHVETHLK